MTKPHYIAIVAATIDGKIARDSNHMSDWTSKEDKRFLHDMLDQSDVILVGRNTYNTAAKPLSKRKCVVLTRSAETVEEISPNLIHCNPDKVDVNNLIMEKGWQKVAILGGAQTYAYCLEHNLLDDLYLTVEPIVFGSGLSIFGDKGGVDYRFKLISTKVLNPEGALLLHYSLNAIS